jgi:hypothetical protein
LIKGGTAPLPSQRRILNLLFQFRHRRATDPRDGLFALGGIVSDSERALVTPNYSKPFFAICREFVAAWLNHYGSLHILTLPSKNPFSPWFLIPFRIDYDSRLGQALFWSEGLDDSPTPPPWSGQFSASGTSRASHSICHLNKDVIVLKAFWVDTIEVVCPLYKPPLLQQTINHRESVKGWKHLAQQYFSKKGITQTSLDMDFELTVTAGCFEAPPTSRSAIKIYQMAIKNACSFRRFFITKNGRMGIGPAEMRTGDSACVFLGAAVPLIILHDEYRGLQRDGVITGSLKPLKTRPHPKSPVTSSNTKNLLDTLPLHAIVGQAYVHGIMKYQGDIQEDILREKLPLVDFRFA